MTRRFKFLFFPLLLTALFLAFSCTPKGQPDVNVPAAPKKALPNDKGTEIWQAFHSNATKAVFLSGPFRISSTLRYTNDKGETTRASSLLWGNGNANDPRPLRLDILTGVGSVAAKISETDSYFLAYVPDEKRAFLVTRQERALASFGVPIPLSLGSLTQILTGLPGALFLPAGGDSAETPDYVLTNTGARFTVVGSDLPGELDVSPGGIPLAWREAGGNGWSITFEPGDKNPLQPKKLRIEHPRGYSALVMVKAAIRVSPPYQAEQLTLELPPGTAIERPVED